MEALVGVLLKEDAEQSAPECGRGAPALEAQERRGHEQRDVPRELAHAMREQAADQQ
jgi:hypothetical protein